MPSQDNSLREIEIKLSAKEKTLEKIVNNPVFNRYGNAIWQQKKLLNQYIDSADYQLTKANVALRVRKDGEQYIQTLKSKGNSVGGFSARDEFDWYLNSSQLDRSLLVSPYWPEKLHGFDKSSLMTIFSTDFVRQYAQFIWDVDGEQALIEVAVDQGTVKALHQQTGICELELELKSGNANTMLNFAIELASQFPLIPSNLSKAERGYRLINPDVYKKTMVGVPVEGSFDDQVKYYLAVSQYYWETYNWQPELSRLVSWVEALQNLCTLLKDQNIEELISLLEPMLLDWKKIIEMDSKEWHKKVFEESNCTRLGVFLLSASHWLLNRH